MRLGSVIAKARSAMSKNAIQAWGLDTSPWKVPLSLMKVPGRSTETVGPSLL